VVTPTVGTVSVCVCMYVSLFSFIHESSEYDSAFTNNFVEKNDQRILNKHSGSPCSHESLNLYKILYEVYN
jgi:hypothetical protein